MTRASHLACLFVVVASVSLLPTLAQSAGTPSIPSGSDVPEVVPFQTDTFWRFPAGGGLPYETDAYLLATSAHAYWYIETSLPSWFGKNYTATQMDGITAAYEGTILPRLHAAFGEEPLPPDDIDGDPRSTILITTDLSMFDDRNEEPVTVHPYSNEREMVYVQYDANITHLLAVVAHEVTHLIGWRYDPGEEAFVGEGLAQVATIVAGYPDSSASDYMANTSVGLMSGIYHGRASYGAWELFVQYLADRFGGWELTRALTQNPERGIPGVESTLRTLGHDEDLRGVFRDWAITNLVNDPGHEPYHYANATARASVQAAAGSLEWQANLSVESGGVAYVDATDALSSGRGRLEVMDIILPTDVDSLAVVLVVRDGTRIDVLNFTRLPSRTFSLETGPLASTANATIVIAHWNGGDPGDMDYWIRVRVSPSPLPFPVAWLAGAIVVAAVASVLLILAFRRRRKAPGPSH